ncbi:hypothetical protein TNCV_2834401 [Trichonephila clavipes]|nr:hypothetical protein TNCV_2834401 [Trichonephila clavipes]
MESVVAKCFFILPTTEIRRGIFGAPVTVYLGEVAWLFSDRYHSSQNRRWADLLFDFLDCRRLSSISGCSSLGHDERTTPSSFCNMFGDG